MPKIMVAMATYNGARYLGEMLRSLARQTRKPEKVFVADDASKDSTVQILEAFKGLPIEVIRQSQNCGVTANFSTAIEAALRECSDEDFIALADQDDIWLPEKLEILEREIGGADLVFGDAEVIDAEGKLMAASWRRLAGLPTELSFKARLTSQTNVTGCMSLCRACMLKKALPIPPQTFLHDEWFGIFAANGAGVKAVPEQVIQYRLHDSNTIGLRHKLTMSEVIKRNTRNSETLLAEPRLHLTEEERDFLKRYLLHLNRIERGFLLPGELPWAVKNRDDLFQRSNRLKRIRQILFQCAGLRFARIFFGKS